MFLLIEPDTKFLGMDASFLRGLYTNFMGKGSVFANKAGYYIYKDGKCPY